MFQKLVLASGRLENDMIKVSLPEGVVYDMLSILHVKQTKTDNVSVKQSVLDLEKEICDQIGQELHATILGSSEYDTLMGHNLSLFNLIDHLKSNERDGNRCYDLEVDKLNYSRWLAKNALQETFFPNSAAQEIKIGYSSNGRKS